MNVLIVGAHGQIARTQTVRNMEPSGLLSRHVESAMPPMVEYHLTELGRRFVEPVELL